MSDNYLDSLPIQSNVGVIHPSNLNPPPIQPVSGPVSGPVSAPVSATGSAPVSATQPNRYFETDHASNNDYILRITNIPHDLSHREATLIFSLVIDHIIKIDYANDLIVARFNNFNTCLTTFKLLNQKCIFGNDIPINVEIDENLSYDFNNLSLRGGLVNGLGSGSGSMSGPGSGSISAPGTSTLGPAAAPASGPATAPVSVLPPNRSRFSFNDPFQEFENKEIENELPWNNQLQSSSQPQTPINNLNFDWGQSNNASLASKNSSNRRTSSAFFQSNFSNSLMGNSFLNSNLNSGVLNQHLNPLMNNQIMSLVPQGQQGQQLSQQGQQLQGQQVPQGQQGQQLPGQQPQVSQGQIPQGQPQGQQPQVSGQAQGQASASAPAQAGPNPPSQPQQLPGAGPSLAETIASRPLETRPTPSASTVVTPTNSSNQVPQTSPSLTASNQTSSSSLTSPVEQISSGRKDVPDLSLLARVPPPANPADQNPPCNTLYVGNLPPDATEQELRALFSPQKGFRRLSFRTKTNTSGSGSNNHGPMCFVEFEDVAHATRALAELYGRILPRSNNSSGKGGIRLSFSKNPLGVRGSQRRSSSNQVNGNFNYNYIKP